ncbi:MAG: response regulator transcription factor [Planctomycetota bacterium]|nr:response regulator transcription factor [Planctomycetota bacterium]
MSQVDSTVFVVDDDPSVCRALSRLIRSVGLNVKTFTSARKFLDSCPLEVPGCLVLDVRMPGMSGLEIQDWLDEAGIRIPIIFITGHGNIAMSVKAIKGGAIDFLEKPFDDQALVDGVHRAIALDTDARRDQAEVDEIRQRVQRLTPRELEVLSFVVTGMLNKQIGMTLGTSEKTIKVHRSRVMQKMRAGSLAELIRLADRAGVAHPKV